MGPGTPIYSTGTSRLESSSFVPPKKVTQGFAGPMTLAGSSSDEAELLVVARGFEPQWTDLLDAYKDENQDTLLDVRINLKSYDSVHHRFQELADLWGWLQETEYGYDDVPEKYLPHISGEDWAPLVQIPAEVRAELNELLCKETVPLGDLSQDEQEGWHQDARELAKRICSAV